MFWKKKDPCAYHKRRWAKHTIMAEGGVVEVCNDCKDRLLYGIRKSWW
jgi:hypothetical protein